MEFSPLSGPSLAGFLLGASPLLLDPNFKQSVVLLSAHTPEDGAVGVVINRPTGQSLGALRDDVEGPLLQNLPVYYGGPVATNEILLVAWRWNRREENFRLYFGMEPEKLDHLVRSDPSIEARAFLGYSGWGGGQLENELQRFDWAICPFLQPFGKLSTELLWRQLLISVRPEWSVLADVPDDPSLN